MECKQGDSAAGFLPPLGKKPSKPLGGSAKRTPEARATAARHHDRSRAASPSPSSPRRRSCSIPHDYDVVIKMMMMMMMTLEMRREWGSGVAEESDRK